MQELPPVRNQQLRLNFRIVFKCKNNERAHWGPALAGSALIPWILASGWVTLLTNKPCNTSDNSLCRNCSVLIKWTYAFVDCFDQKWIMVHVQQTFACFKLLFKSCKTTYAFVDCFDQKWIMVHIQQTFACFKLLFKSCKTIHDLVCQLR